MTMYSKRVLSLLLIIFLIGFPQISETIYTPALPNIAHALNTTGNIMQWTLSVYFVGFAIGVLFWGQLSDRIGRRPCMLLGIVIYILSSVACALSESVNALLFFRIFQALGASVGSVITQAMIYESFDDQKRHHIYVFLGLALSSVSALGPLMGGYINDWFHWRANFIALVIMGIIIIVYALIRLPETKPAHVHVSDSKEIKQITWRLITHRHVLGCMWVTAVFSGILFSFYAEAPFIFVRLLKFTPAGYGKVGLFIAAASFTGSLTTRKMLTQHWSAHSIMRLGMWIGTLSALLLMLIMTLTLPMQHPILALFLIMVPFGAVMFAVFGLVLPFAMSQALVEFKSCLGTASALFGLGYYVITALLTWLMGLLHNGTVYPLPIYFFVLMLTASFAFWKYVKV